MTEQFNPKVLFDNVDFLIKSENRKIGEVESDAGVSAGSQSAACRVFRSEIRFLKSYPQSVLPE